MTKHYQHTQIGYLMIISLTIAITFFTYRMTYDAPNLEYYIAVFVLAAGLILFPTLTVKIEEDYLKIFFGL